MNVFSIFLAPAFYLEKYLMNLLLCLEVLVIINQIVIGWWLAFPAQISSLYFSYDYVEFSIIDCSFFSNYHHFSSRASEYEIVLITFTASHLLRTVGDAKWNFLFILDKYVKFLTKERSFSFQVPKNVRSFSSAFFDFGYIKLLWNDNYTLVRVV